MLHVVQAEENFGENNSTNCSTVILNLFILKVQAARCTCLQSVEHSVLSVLFLLRDPATLNFECEDSPVKT